MPFSSPLPDPADIAGGIEETPLMELTAAALKSIAKKRGIKGYGGMTKEELVEAISGEGMGE